MLANSPATLPTGRMLIETYAFTQRQKRSSLQGSLTYLLYGVTDRLTVGAKPFFGMAASSSGSSRPSFGDLTLSTQYRLTPPEQDPSAPILALSVQRSLPTGRFDRLSGYRGTALGSGAPATTVAFYAQQIGWLANGRIVRGRLNLSGAWSDTAKIRGASVYGTPADFAGRARPGATFVLGASGEYSLTRELALALDLVVTHGRSTRVRGRRTSLDDMAYRLPAATSIAIAPAVEYSWRPNLGVLLAARFIPSSGAVPASVTPAVALNYVR